jgi:hypothetical protein
MLPAFAVVAREGGGLPLSLIEVGASAGLNLHWDRYHHSYTTGSVVVLRWGEPASPVQLTTELRGGEPLPELTPRLRVARRVGIDLDPIDLDDPDAMLWLRALVFPEHLDRHREIEAAMSVAREHPAELMRGDVLERLSELLSRVPADTTACLYASMVLEQFSAEMRQQLWQCLCESSRSRPCWLISMDGTPHGDAKLLVGKFSGGARQVRQMATAHPHGRWLEWLGAH